MNLEENSLEFEELSSVKTKADFFKYLFSELAPNTEPTPEAAYDLFSWAIQIERGPFATPISTFKSWMRDTSGGGFEARAVPGRKRKISVIQHFSETVYKHGFRHWGSQTDKKPSRETCIRVNRAISRFLNHNLRLRPRGRSAATRTEIAQKGQTAESVEWRLPEELVAGFARSPANSSTYARFGREIPFLSRRQFEDATTAQYSWSEVDHFEDFLGDSDKASFIISGRGGVGKTKLSEQLVSRLSSDRWEVFYLSNRASTGSIAKFLDSIHRDQKYCVVIDYLEETEALYEFVVGIHDRVSEGKLDGRNIKTVATCRSSSRQGIEKRLVRYRQSLTHLSLDEMNDNSDGRYLSWVVEKILQMHFQSNWKDYARLCASTPSTAVFFCALENRRQNLVLKGDLVGANRCEQGLRQPAVYDNFQAWVDRHLARTLQTGEWGETESLKEVTFSLASIFSILPEKYLTLHSAEQYQRHVGRLVDDGWLHVSHEGPSDHDGDIYLYPPHDTFTEAIINTWVKSHKSEREFIEFRADAFQLMSEVSSKRKLGNFLRTLDKCEMSDRYIKTLRATLREIVVPAENAKRFEPAISSAIVAILGSRLATPEIKIAAIEGVNTLPSSSLRAVVSFAQDMSSMQHEAAHLTFDLVQRRVLEVISRDGPNANRLIRAFEGFPDMFKGAVATKLESEISVRASSMLLACWFRSGLPHESVEPQVKRWLEFNGESRIAARLLLDLIESDAAHDIDHELTRWLGAVRGGIANAELPEAAPLLLARVRKGGDLQRFERFVTRWLLKYPDSPSALGLLKFLTPQSPAHSTAKRLMASQTFKRLELNPNDPYQTNHDVVTLLKVAATLEAGSAAAEVVADWASIEELYLNSSAQRVFSSWLEQKGDPSVISGAFNKYLDAWVSDEIAQPHTTGWYLLFKNWIKFSGEKNSIIPHVQRWIKTVDFRTFFDGQDFLAEWLRQVSMPIEPIFDAIWAWLSNPDHLRKKNSRHIIHAIAHFRPMLVDEEHRERFRKAADLCILELQGEEDCFYVLSDVLALRLPFTYTDQLISWLNEYGASSNLRVATLLTLWMKVSPTDPNLRWYLISYLSKRVYASASALAWDNDLLIAWKNENFPFRGDIVNALSKRLSNTSDLSISTKLLERLNRCSLSEPALASHYKRLAEELHARGRRSGLVVECVAEVVKVDPTDPWLAEFVEQRVLEFPDEAWPHKFSLIVRWKEAGRDPNELMPLLAYGLETKAVQLDRSIGRSLGLWMSLMLDTDQEPKIYAWSQGWISYNLVENPWSVGSFLLSLSEFKPAFSIFFDEARLWLEMHRNPASWRSGKWSLYFKILSVYLLEEEDIARAKSMIELSLDQDDIPPDARTFFLETADLTRFDSFVS